MLKVRIGITVSVFLIGLGCASLWAQDNVMTNSGTWFTSANWSLGHAPTNTENAVINTNVVVSYAAGTPNYTGNLVLREGAQFDFHLSGSIQAYFPSDRTSEVHCYDGSKIEVRDGDGSATNPIVLYGDFTIQRLSSVSATMYLTSPIRGAGHLTLQPNIPTTFYSRRIVINNVSPSTYTGGTTIEQHSGESSTRTYLGVKANYAFGTGDVTIDGTGSTEGATLKFEGSTTNAIDDGASLYLVGNAILDLQNDTETVNKLFFDGVEQAAGTWGPSTSAAVNTNDTYFKGTTGILTVLGLGGDTQPPVPSPMEFSSFPTPLTTTSIVMTATEAVDSTPPIYYLFTNDTTGASSSWSTNRTWTNNVAADSVNDYRVKAKDDLGNETDWSTPPFTQSPLINNIMTNSGTWATAANWSRAHMPTNTETAIINTNIVVSYSATINPYTGNLILREGAKLDFGLSGFAGDYFPAGAASEIHCYDGSLIEIRNGTASKPIVLHGNLTIQHQNQAILTYTSTFSDAPGSVGSLTIQREGDWSGRRLQFSPSSPSTYSGGTTIEPHPTVADANNIVWVDQNDAFGTGDVTIDGTVNAMTLIFNGSTTDVIDDGASLYLVGNAILDLQSNTETVDRLFIDGEPQVIGTWGAAASGAEHTNDTFFATGRTGVLTVLNTDIPSAGTIFIFQ